jgi:hypothetical protein
MRVNIAISTPNTIALKMSAVMKVEVDAVVACAAVEEDLKSS